jgi:type III restriction enzyme
LSCLTRPGRNVRGIVSVGMLTEGWDCNTVTHVIGLRPFMSQLLCEQVVGKSGQAASRPGSSRPRVSRDSLPPRRGLQAVRSRLVADWANIPPLFLDPTRIPPEVEVKASLPTNSGHSSSTVPASWSESI